MSSPAKNVETAEEEEEPFVSPDFAIDFIGQSWEWQMMHGLRNEDYHRYRQYCSRRLRRIYKGLKFLHGTSKRYAKKTVTPRLAKDERHVMVLFMQAERAWAYAMAIKNDNSEGDLRKTHHQLAKLAKAEKFSSELVQLCSETCTQATQKQAEAYHLEMCGYNSLGQQAYEQSLDYFTKARDMWVKFQSAAKDTKEKEILTKRITATEHNRRFCWHKAGKDPSKFKSVVSTDAKSGGAATGANVTWMGHTLQLHSEKLRGLVEQATAQAEEVETVKAKQEGGKEGTTYLNATLEVYDKLFLTYNDAMADARQALKNESADSTMMTRILHYLQFNLWNNTVKRNQFVVQFYSSRYQPPQDAEKRSRGHHGPADIVRLYDMIIQNVTDILGIPLVEDDDTMGPQFTSLSLLARAKKMYWKGEGFRVVKQYEESLACIKFGEQLISECALHARKEGLQAGEECNKLAEMLRESRCVVYAAGYAAKAAAETGTDKAASADEKVKPKKYLVDNLEKWDLDKTAEFVPIPAPLVSMSVKPTFYDIASQFIEYPDLSGYQIKKEKSKKKEEKKEAGATATQEKTKEAKETKPEEEKPAAGGGSWLKRWVWGS
eukprot:TRINITY_DN28576_c0_g1_i1.p1 TRINITY_DN28576_c0_g1~~TRINITY_DN28576_c0_g1_i1.p1  ORF type:complete len:605 (-),score=104.38 TRINITY_DN28576_c0_g1_i1:1995-3809(-)